MKKLLFVAISFFLSVSINAYAGCGGGGCGGSSGGCGGDSGACPTNSCGGTDYSGTCQCTDPSCGSNSCLNGEKCCKYFGNIGMNDPIYTYSDESDENYAVYDYSSSFSTAPGYKGEY